MFRLKPHKEKPSELSAKELKELFLDLSPIERKEVVYNFNRYLDLIERISDRIDSKKIPADQLKNSHLRKEWSKRYHGNDRVAQANFSNTQVNKKHMQKH